MCRPYDTRLLARALELARLQNTPMHKGVFVAVLGPNLETRAEYRFLRLIGADVVGMSTVPETLVAVHAGLRVLGFSIITDMCLPDSLKPANIDEILATAHRTEPQLRKIVTKIVAEQQR
jgi:purine-nucleoside phosphorylase